MWNNKFIRWGYYNIKVNLDNYKGNIKKDELNKVHYKLLKECNVNVWKELFEKFENNHTLNLLRENITDSD